MKTVDIKPNFADMLFETAEGELVMTVRLPAGNQGGINPMLFVDAAEKFFDKELLVRIERTRLFDGNFKEFE